MEEGAIALIITSAGIFAVFIGLFVWGIFKKQFHDVEEAKYRMLESEDEQNGTGKKGEDANA